MNAGDSWGRLGPTAQQEVIRLSDRHAPLPLREGQRHLPYGNGRSYGDCCLNAGGVLLHARGLDRFIDFDPETGVLSCEAGVLLSEILALVLPRGWFLPVTPGTQYVTVGGAIANDVHGKNHHVAGCFGRHVLAFELARSDGSVRLCTPVEHPELFAATIGGLGLTGLIRWARLQLRRCANAAVEGESLKFANLDEFFALSAESDQRWEYTAAWVDCLAAGATLGRGIFLRGNHAADPAPVPTAAARRLRVPCTPPLSLVNPATLRIFNAAYYGMQARRHQERTWDWEPFFYPLDRILEWNRIYGPRGFYQYQCVVPMASARDSLTGMLQRIARSGQGSFLAVLKVFGDLQSPGLLSFPRAGATLALDFANQGAPTLALLEALDEITRAAGGAVYPAKDARMSPAAFAAYFPRLEAFRPWMDPAFSSSLWRRLNP